ncbi:peptidylprolyl isomerase [Carboxylicivirga caseinilyticus]|uniref:peptidylprolyl isomerase n=1 Tax=Carboxylicivirga caseinilyticus TaxID=3417572 RepID=UPI003D32F58E|nr:peptidylprolyl isomerase [Marinilabiliaceae bacterium A049]
MNKVVALLAVALLFASCSPRLKPNQVLFKTNKGDILIELYDETPKHRDNFKKLASEGFYDQLLFHRVIKEFMIQGGDPESKGAEAGKQLGNGGPGYTIDAEIDFPKLFHKKGALAAARMGDNVNPEKKSSGSQFYIVQGKTFTDEEFVKVENRLKSMQRQGIFYQTLEGYKDTLMSLRQAGDQQAVMDMQMKINELVEEKVAAAPDVTIPENIKEVYRTIGGVPHLDGNYTVFGEVIEGLDIVDSIAAVECDNNDRPIEDVVIEKVFTGK